MLERFYPDVYISSTYKIDFDEYYRQGYRGIIFDIDNTLVIHGAPADKRSAELIEKLHNMGFQILFLSNNKEPRVKMFSDAVKGKYIFKAGKPGKKRISAGYGDAGDGQKNHAFCRRSIVYGCVGSQKYRHFLHFGSAH